MKTKMISLNLKKLPQRRLRKQLPKRQKRLLLTKKRLLKEKKENDHFKEIIYLLIYPINFPIY
jgi:hypothetical protein